MDAEMKNLTPTDQEQYAKATLDNIKAARQDIDNLIKIILLRKKECDDMENETRYLKEYVASFISMGELQK